MQEPPAGEHGFEDEATQQPFPRSRLPRFADCGPRFVHHERELDARRTGGFAGAAFQAQKHVLFEGDAGRRYAALVDGLHQVDTAARRIHFASQLQVRGTDREAEAAVNAVQVGGFVFCWQSGH